MILVVVSTRVVKNHVCMYVYMYVCVCGVYTCSTHKGVIEDTTVVEVEGVTLCTCLEK